MQTGQSSTQYTCPMHPELQQEQPGTCPKCGMQLVPQEQHGREHQQMDGDDHLAMTRQMREKWLWTNFTIISLGVWLISSPFTFGYTDHWIAWNDVVSGLLLAFFAALALWPRYDFVGRWSVCFVGLWLQFAPLVLWAPTPASYLNDTLVGAFAITLSILVPMMPGMAHHMAMMKPGPEIPPGWSYNPSSWHQRAPMIGLALVGWFISRYLAAYQLGYTETVWEPFFGKGTVNVLESEVSHMWPVSDAGLGAVAYTIEMLMGWMGAKNRWRTMPWMVLFFFLLVVPLGLVHIVLVILQPVVVGYWCTLCLAAAFVMLCMIPFTVDEVVATIQFMTASARQGKPLWRTFWVGDTMEGGGPDNRTPKYGAPAVQMVPPMAWGVTLPWNLLISAALGVWLMFSPALFGSEGTAADSNHVVGALIVTVSVIVTAEVIRTGRFLNLVLGFWVAIAPWLLDGAAGIAVWNNAAVGLALIALSIPRGGLRERYAGWDRYIK